MTGGHGTSQRDETRTMLKCGDITRRHDGGTVYVFCDRDAWSKQMEDNPDKIMHGCDTHGVLVVRDRRDSSCIPASHANNPPIGSGWTYTKIGRAPKREVTGK